MQLSTAPHDEPALREHATIAGIRASAVLETVGGLVVLLLLDALFFSGDRFWSVNPHPFWIVVLLMAAQYGTAEGLLAAALSTIALLLFNVPEAKEGANYFAWIFSVSINPVLWLIGGWLLGELRQRHVRDRNRLARELDESRERERVITDSYQFVKTRKESLEVQVSGQLLSSIEAYRAAKSVETLDPKAVMQGVERLVKSILGPQKFSLFIATTNKLSATILHGWSAQDTYSQEIDSFSPLYQAVVGSRDLLVIANEQHEIALDAQGLMAGPVLDPETNRVIGMLKIEAMDFTSLSLQTVETFRALCDWIGTALTNARNFQNAKSDSVLDSSRNLYSFSYFKRQSEYMRVLAKRANFDLSMLVVRLNDSDKLGDNERITVARQIGESVRSVLRSIDLPFDYQTDGDEYSILLPATSQSGAAIVRDKIVADLNRALRGKSGVSFNYIVQALHETR